MRLGFGQDELAEESKLRTAVQPVSQSVSQSVGWSVAWVLTMKHFSAYEFLSR